MVSDTMEGREWAVKCSFMEIYRENGLIFVVVVVVFVLVVLVLNSFIGAWVAFCFVSL